MEDKFRDDIVLLENILDRRSPPAELSLSFLKYITNDFSDERVAGRGGFGVVYKGEFKNRNVAVKKLTNYSDKAEQDFSREIDSLMHVNHKNIVHFLGYCNEIKSKRVDAVKPGQRQEFVYIQDRMLCFEYIGNGSLSGNIQDELRGLEWHTRYKIIKEICQALDYLHNKRKMVHRDLKPDNILLDNLMVPKVADLGLSKILDDGASKAITMNAASSLGYCDPEFKGGIVKYSYDIYSLGVIIIELVTGFKRAPDLQTVLTRWRHRWNKSNEILRYHQVAKCIEIGLLCKNRKVKNRPKISKIIKDLDDVDGGNGAVGQEIPCWSDLLWFEPSELFFPFEINKQMTCSLELINESDACMAFFIEQDGEFEYDMVTNKGIVQPRSHFSVSITLVAQEEKPDEMQNADEFTIRSKKVKGILTDEDITEGMFSEKSPDLVYKVCIGVVFDAKLRAPCCIPREPEEHLSLGPLEISGCQEKDETSSEAESSTQSLRDLHKEGGKPFNQEPQACRSTASYIPWSVGSSQEMATGESIEISLASELTEGAISFDCLRRITNNFSKERELGTGALGTVYKGILEDGWVIAVKRHVKDAPGTHNIEEYKTKVKSLMGHNHENVVRLLAFCIETRMETRRYNGTNIRQKVVESLLCYEYLPKGSLQKNLFGELACSMDWNTRFKIIKGVCQGVRFLHELSQPILHLDLKPQNILLDHNLVPKIIDFACSRLIGEEQTITNTDDCVGSVGYRAPEFVNHGEISVWTDIYSLGVMILEITTGEKNHASADEQSARNFIKNVKEEWTNERKIAECANLPEDCHDQLNTCLKIGLECVNLNQHRRPDIVEIVNRLSAT